MKTTGISLAVLALIGDSQAVDVARSFYLPHSLAQSSKNANATKSVTADDYNDADKYDKFESSELQKTPMVSEGEAEQRKGVPTKRDKRYNKLQRKFLGSRPSANNKYQ